MTVKSFKVFFQSLAVLVLLPLIGIFVPYPDTENSDLTDSNMASGKEGMSFNEIICTQEVTDNSGIDSIAQTNFIFFPLILQGLVCGWEPEPPGDTFCPVICNGGCADNVCSIVCSAPYGNCNNSAITCPPGYACEVLCDGLASCEASTINCPSDYACDVICAGSHACEDALINCSENGTCDLMCTTEIDICTNAIQNCGFNRCSAHCLGSSYPTTNCGPSCDCITCE